MDCASLAELCSFQHAHSNGWYRTKHQVDMITISIPDDPSGLWENRSLCSRGFPVLPSAHLPPRTVGICISGTWPDLGGSER